MQIINIKRIITTITVMLSVAGMTFASTASVRVGDDEKGPELPPECVNIQAPAGNRAAFRTYALGVQLYRWNGTSWSFVAPVANLYASPNFRGKIGSHFAGPTWESNNGSSVVGRRVDGCSPNPTAIDWLLLSASSNDVKGIFSGVTYIQRVNTAGGKAPTTPGSYVDEIAKVPYTTEYYFYRTRTKASVPTAH